MHQQPIRLQPDSADFVNKNTLIKWNYFEDGLFVMSSNPSRVKIQTTLIIT